METQREGSGSCSIGRKDEVCAVHAGRLGISKEPVSPCNPHIPRRLQISGAMPFSRLTNLFHFAWGFVGFNIERPEAWGVAYSWANVIWSQSSLLAKLSMRWPQSWLGEVKAASYTLWGFGASDRLHSDYFYRPPIMLFV